MPDPNPTGKEDDNEGTSRKEKKNQSLDEDKEDTRSCKDDQNVSEKSSVVSRLQMRIRLVLDSQNKQSGNGKKVEKRRNKGKKRVRKGRVVKKKPSVTKHVSRKQQYQAVAKALAKSKKPPSNAAQYALHSDISISTIGSYHSLCQQCRRQRHRR